jgi:hypothetical protein
MPHRVVWGRRRERMALREFTHLAEAEQFAEHVRAIGEAEFARVDSWDGFRYRPRPPAK